MQKPVDMSTWMGNFPKVPPLDEELQAINEETQNHLLQGQVPDR